MTDQADQPSPKTMNWVSLLTLGANIPALLWVYWPTLTAMARRWGDDPRYSHGYLVPAFALVWLWLTRSRIAISVRSPNPMGLVLILGGLALRSVGTFTFFEWAEAISILPILAGLIVLGGGWSLLLWAWPAVAFLTFMVPLPYRIEIAMDWPLQRMATVASTYLLQTLGLPAIGSGNIINIGEAQIGVVEACSGLSMLVLFVAMSTAAAMVSRRPLWERLALVAGSVPIALTANITRIVATAVVHETMGARFADLVFHDLAGWLMMPLALFLLWIQSWILSRLVLPPLPSFDDRSPLPALIPTGAHNGRNIADLRSTRGPGR